jgi:hypothetical protein
MLRRIAAALWIVSAASLAGGPPASAAQVSVGPQLVCSVFGGTTGASRCSTLTHSSTNLYSVLFSLPSVNAGDITGWNVPSQNVSSSGPGCVAGQSQCWVTIRSTDTDTVGVTVTVSFHWLNGISLQPRSATVTVPGRCSAAC